MGAGIILTNVSSVPQLPELPFGVRYDPSQATTGLKNNLLCEFLSDLEILQLQSKGLQSPRYYEMANGYQIFIMQDRSMRTDTRNEGFFKVNGSLIYTRFDRSSYILTFSFVMLLISINPTFPAVVRKAAVSCISNNPVAMPLKHGSNSHYDALHLVKSLTRDVKVSSSGHFGIDDHLALLQKAESPYTPQSGQVPTPVVPPQDRVEELLKRIDMSDVSPLLSNFQESLGKACYFYLSHLMKGNLLACSLSLIFLYVVYRICVQLIFTFSFGLGIIVGWYICGREQELRKKYRPQSGIDTEGLNTVLVQYIHSVYVWVRQFFEGFYSIDHPSFSCPPYSPQSTAEESEMPQEAPPSEDTGALTDDQQQELRSTVTAVSDHLIKEAIIRRTSLDIRNWQRNPRAYPLPRDILNRGVAFSPMMQATLHDALLYKPVEKVQLGFNSP